MKIIYNKYIPFGDFFAINLFGVLFVKSKNGEKVLVSNRTINHEKIHTAQMKELGYIFFYLIYFFEWLIKCFIYKNTITAYYNISFEKEAYLYQNDFNYLNFRQKFYYFKLF